MDTSLQQHALLKERKTLLKRKRKTHLNPDPQLLALEKAETAPENSNAWNAVMTNITQKIALFSKLDNLSRNNKNPRLPIVKKPQELQADPKPLQDQNMAIIPIIDMKKNPVAKKTAHIVKKILAEAKIALAEKITDPQLNHETNVTTEPLLVMINVLPHSCHYNSYHFNSPMNLFKTHIVVHLYLDMKM